MYAANRNKYHLPEATTLGDFGRQPVCPGCIFEYRSGHVAWKKILVYTVVGAM